MQRYASCCYSEATIVIRSDGPGKKWGNAPLTPIPVLPQSSPTPHHLPPPPITCQIEDGSTIFRDFGKVLSTENQQPKISKLHPLTPVNLYLFDATCRSSRFLKRVLIHTSTHTTVVMLKLLLVLAVLDSALPLRHIHKRRDLNSVVKLHIVKRPILPFNITFLQDPDDYAVGIDGLLEDSVSSFLHQKFEETYRPFYAMEMENHPSSAEVEWPNVRINVSFTGNFIFVLSGNLPENSELHCLQRHFLLEDYQLEFEDLVNNTEEIGEVELDFIHFEADMFCPPIDHYKWDDDYAVVGKKSDDGYVIDHDKSDNDDGNKETATETTRSQPKEKSINLKEFLLSWEFLCIVLATVVLPMLVCLGCVHHKTWKLRRIQNSTSVKSKRDSDSSRKTAATTSSQSSGSH